MRLTGIIISVFILFILGCEEEPPFIDLQGEEVDTSLIDTTYVSSTDTTPETKNILIEDYTGVQCPNCPTAAKIAEEIADENPGRVVILAIHANDLFGEPFPESKEDYRIEEGQELYDFFGQKPQPAGDVDRFLFPNEDEVMVIYNKWKQYANQRLNASTPVNLELTKSFDSTSSDLVIKVKLHYTEEVNERQFISICLTQSNIIDYQINETEKIPDYEHDHVLRHFITPAKGYKLADDVEKNRIFIKEFRIKLDDIRGDLWVYEDMGITAFAHTMVDNFTVYQTKEIRVTE